MYPMISSMFLLLLVIVGNGFSLNINGKNVLQKTKVIQLLNSKNEYVNRSKTIDYYNGTSAIQENYGWDTLKQNWMLDNKIQTVHENGRLIVSSKQYHSRRVRVNRVWVDTSIFTGNRDSIVFSPLGDTLEKIYKTSGMNWDKWLNIQKVQYRYNASRLLIEERRYDTLTSVDWKTKLQIYHDYDKQGKMICKYFYQPIDTLMILTGKDSMFYDGQGNCIECRTMSWNGNSWSVTYKEKWSYTPDNKIKGHLTETLVNNITVPQQYDSSFYYRQNAERVIHRFGWTEKSWKLFSRDSLCYFQDGSLQSLQSEGLQENVSGSTSGVFTIYRQYDNNGCLLNKTDIDSLVNYNNSTVSFSALRELYKYDSMYRRTELLTASRFPFYGWRNISKTGSYYVHDEKINDMYQWALVWVRSTYDTVVLNTSNDSNCTIMYLTNVHAPDYALETSPSQTKVVVVYNLQNSGTVSENFKKENSSSLNAFPNPFNPVVSIEYDLKENGRVGLQIVDINGRTIAKFLDADQLKGKYTFVWNADSMPTGLYIIRLSFGAKILTRRIHLQK